MEDIFGKLVGIFIGVTLLFLIPLMYFRERRETMEQLYLITETTEFVDTVRMNGRLTKENYTYFMDKLSFLSKRYEIRMTGKHRRVGITDKTLVLHNEEFYENRILEALEEEGAYAFSYGDFFKVEIIGYSPDVLSLFKRNYEMGGKRGSVDAYYGGMVGCDG